MRKAHALLLGFILLGLFSARATFAQSSPCPVNMTRAGATCVDIYEVSVWSQSPAGNKAKGTQYGADTDDYPCHDNGNDCTGEIYAASLPGVKPARHITWFQAQQACANVGKRLLRSGEWQMLAAGTPDPGDAPSSTTCNTNGIGDTVETGSRPECVSNWGVHDMVGNVWEWVEDWTGSTRRPVEGQFTSNAAYGEDLIIGLNDALFQGGGRAMPGAFLRGGGYDQGEQAGVFAVFARAAPSTSGADIGARCGY